METTSHSNDWYSNELRNAKNTDRTFSKIASGLVFSIGLTPDGWKAYADVLGESYFKYPLGCHKTAEKAQHACDDFLKGYMQCQ